MKSKIHQQMDVVISQLQSNQKIGCHGLRRHRDGKWDWVRAPYLGSGIKPRNRYQHSGLFLGSLMFVVGGRTYNVHENLKLDIFDTDTSEWHSINNLQRFRHCAWMIKGDLYIQGGFKQDSPEVPVSDVKKIDLLAALEDKPNLLKKIRNFLGAQANSHPNSKDTTRSNSPIMSRPPGAIAPKYHDDNGMGDDMRNPNAMEEEKQILFKLPINDKKGGKDQFGNIISNPSNVPLHMEFLNI